MDAFPVLLLALCPERLTADDRARLESHARNCPICTSLVGRFRSDPGDYPERLEAMLGRTDDKAEPLPETAV